VRASDFHFDLPEELVAQTPLAERRASRLLVLDGASGALADRRFADLPELLSPGDLLVLNDTRVVKARLAARKASGGRAEVLVERETGKRRFLAHVRASKSPRPGTRLRLADAAWATVTARAADLFELELDAGEDTLEALLEAHGSVPLPPYIRRAPERRDEARYQTVFARDPGAVAAPTAGLHLDRELLESIRERGVELDFVTLHVGAGTFQPVRAGRLEDHHMHAERVRVGAGTCRRIEAAHARGARVVAVGTTVVRALEAASRDGSPRPLDGETRLFIRPGHAFRCVDAMVTNFHLPESTLLMLVCACAGTEAVLAAYRHAVAARYRFFSYGDAMFIAGGRR
jgi:S-adenosylmethionine:tRNA ribosyltransferase-isomerase